VLADAVAQRAFAVAFTKAGVTVNDRPITPRRRLVKQREAGSSEDVSEDDVSTDEGSSGSPTEETCHKATRLGSESTGAEEPRGWKVTLTPTKMASEQTLTSDTEAGSEVDCKQGVSSSGEAPTEVVIPRFLLRLPKMQKSCKAGRKCTMLADGITESDGEEL
jgi:hypothetical protein